MRALTVRPHVANSLSLAEVAEPEPSEGPILIDGIMLGICGTDTEIIHGDYGTAPPGADRLILGHENLGRVRDAPPNCGFAAGDLVVCMVRRPDPVPCPACAVGEWDMCRNGQYTEHGIKGLHGFARQRWRAWPEELVALDARLDSHGVLLEPASVVAKAWEQVDKIGERAFWQPSRVAITGAGPIGLLAALFAVQRGLSVHVYDRLTTGTKPELATALGAQFHGGALPGDELAADIVIECTGVAGVIQHVLNNGATARVLCLTGVSDPAETASVNIAKLSRRAVLRNQVMFGTVNANRRHYAAAARALAAADGDWLDRLITRRVPLTEYREAFRRSEDDVKVVLQLAPQ